jgi:hypothetical protein
MHESKLEELDLEAALNFATNALGNAAAFGFNARPIKNSDSKRCCFQMV